MHQAVQALLTEAVVRAWNDAVVDASVPVNKYIVVLLAGSRGVVAARLVGQAPH